MVCNEDDSHAGNTPAPLPVGAVEEGARVAVRVVGAGAADAFGGKALTGGRGVGAVLLKVLEG